MTFREWYQEIYKGGEKEDWLQKAFNEGVVEGSKLFKGSFTKEQVEKLLKKQREICANKSLSLEKKANQKATMIYYTILNAPSPLEGGKNERL